MICFLFQKNLEYHSSNLIYNAYVSIAATLGVFGLILLINYVFINTKFLLKIIKFSLNNNFNDIYNLLIIAPVWIILTIIFYQSTNWFYSGDVQLAVIIYIITIVKIIYLLTIRENIK